MSITRGNAVQSLVEGDLLVEIFNGILATREILQWFPCRIGIPLPVHQIMETIALLPTVGDVVDLIDIRSCFRHWRRVALPVGLVLFARHVVGLEMAQVPNFGAARWKVFELKGQRRDSPNQTERPNIRGIQLPRSTKAFAGEQNKVTFIEAERFLLFVGGAGRCFGCS